MEEKKKRHITMIWIVLAVLSINQLIHQHQCGQSHQLLWDGMIWSTQVQNFQKK